jgi:hypothetical protein
MGAAAWKDTLARTRRLVNVRQTCQYTARHRNRRQAGQIRPAPIFFEEKIDGRN